MNYLLDDLNEKQREAVLSTEGSLLVLAGAGSGKTKTLTHRIAYLIKEKNISPYSLLAVTFTNKAAREMESRVERLLFANDDNSTGAYHLPWLGTFHSVCVRILRREAHLLGYERNFTIYDSNDSLAIIKRIVKELHIDPKNFAPKSIQYFISGAKNELIDAEEYKKYTSSPFEVVTSKVYSEYEKYLKRVNGMDFDDLIMLCVKLFQQNEDVLKKYQKQFKYILIDEYQDTNQAQYLWTKLLAKEHKNIMVVGDDYQAIYGWRGANFKNILNFEKDYKNTTVIKLEQNYRSTKTILAAADEVIKFNRQRTDKTLWTENQEGVPITVYEALNEKDEAEFVCLEVKSLVKGHSSSNYNDYAVLYRTNAQSRAIEEAMLRFRIPYRVVGGYRFYDRKEVKDIISYLQIIQNPLNQEAFARAATCVPRGIGEKTLLQLREISNIKSQITNNSEILNLKISKKLQDFLMLISEFREQAEHVELSDLINLIAVKTGYKAFLLDGTPEGESRWENVEELMTVASSPLPESAEEEGTGKLEYFLQQIALVQDTDSIDKSADAVTLMTMHSAKGLEFDTVFVIGAEEGLFPHSRALMDESEMEEERRLAYVSITRAKKRLYFIYAGERNIYGRFQSNPKSRFIENISEHLIDEI